MYKTKVKTVKSKQFKFIIKFVIVAILSMALSIAMEFYLYPSIIRNWTYSCDNSYPIDPFIGFSRTRVMIFFIGFLFILIHFIVDRKKLYEKIFDYRIPIACVFLLIVTIGGYHGSSIHRIDGILAYVEGFEEREILGVSRFIRTDEWGTQTTYLKSQSYNDNSMYSDAYRASEKTNMFTLYNSPVKSILMLGRPFQLGFLVLSFNHAFAFYWYGRLVLMLLGSIEIMSILTKKNKRLSIYGGILIAFSAAVQWWYCIDTLIWGQLLVVILDKFMLADKKWKKIMWAAFEFVSLVSYIFVFYPAWMVSFVYTLIPVGIYVLVKNFKEEKYKVNVFDILLVIIVIALTALMVYHWYDVSKDVLDVSFNTVYPGDRVGVGGDEGSLFGYFYNLYMPYESFSHYTDNSLFDVHIEPYLNACESATMLSLYPLPIIVAIIYMIRNKKKDLFLILSCIVSVFLSVYCIVGFPEILAKVTLLSISTGARAAVSLATLCVYIMVYLINVIKEEDKIFESALIKSVFTIGMLSICLCLDAIAELRLWETLLSVILFGSLFYMFFGINHEYSKKFVTTLTIIITLIGGVLVNPIVRGFGAIDNKEALRIVDQIREKDPDGVVLNYTENMILSNIFAANGVKVINTTQVYPNREFYETLFKDNPNKDEYEKIWNRYHHLKVQITYGETRVKLVADDYVELFLNYMDLNKFNIRYIITTKNLNLEKPYGNFKELLVEDTFIVYEVLEQEESKIDDFLSMINRVKEIDPKALWMTDCIDGDDSSMLTNNGIRVLTSEKIGYQKLDDLLDLDFYEEIGYPVNKVATSFMDVFSNIIDVKTYLVSKSRTRFTPFSGNVNFEYFFRLNVSDVKRLNINYILSFRDLSGVSFLELIDEYDLFKLYKVIY